MAMSYNDNGRKLKFDHRNERDKSGLFPVPFSKQLQMPFRSLIVSKQDKMTVSLLLLL